MTVSRGERQVKKIIIIFIILIIAMSIIFRNQILKIIYPKTYNEIIEKYAEEYNIESDLILAVIKSESNFDAKVKSHKGAIGLMQLMRQTAYEVVPNIENLEVTEENIEEKLLEPETNINIGTKYLQMLLEKYSNVEIALTAYNAGTGNVDKWIQQGIINADGSDIEKVPFKETNKYVRSILRDYEIYKELYKDE